MHVDAILSHTFAGVEQHYTAKECAQYALSIGVGMDPMNEAALRFINGTDCATLGSMCLVLATPGFWMDEGWTGIDWRHVLLLEQSYELMEPLANQAHVRSQLRIAGVVNRGADRGALVLQEREITDLDTGRVVARIQSTTLCRNDGWEAHAPEGLQTKGKNTRPIETLAHGVNVITSPQAALLYDLHGIVNPIHNTPSVARKAGFDRPILHGLAIMGHIHHGLVAHTTGYAIDPVTAMRCRFTSPFYPGNTLAVHFDRTVGETVLEARCGQTGKRIAVGHATLGELV